MIILTMIFLIIDVVSKLVVSNMMNVHDSIVVIKDFFNITYVRNTGAAWSMLADKTWLIIIISFAIIGLIALYICKNKPNSKIEKIGYSLVLGGAIGNFIDRIVYGYVIDFFDFYIFGYDYPIFNLADTFIFCGVFLLIVYTWRCKDGNHCIRK